MLSKEIPCLFLSSKTKGPVEEGAAGYCPKILLLKRAKLVLGPFRLGVIGSSALEIGQFLRQNFWMISGGPFLSRPLCFTAAFQSFLWSFQGGGFGRRRKSLWPVTERGGVLSSESKEHRSFCPGTRPGKPVTGVTEQSFMC